MAYEHGVRISEQATSLLPTVEVSAGIPVIIGTAAVNMADPENVNKPKLCYSYAEAVEAFGHVPAELDPESGLKKFRFSISELIQRHFLFTEFVRLLRSMFWILQNISARSPRLQ